MDTDAKIQELTTNEEFQKKLNETKTVQEIADLFAAEGITLDEDELNELAEFQHSGDRELSEEELEDVSGGCIKWFIQWHYQRKYKNETGHKAKCKYSPIDGTRCVDQVTGAVKYY